MDIQVKRADVSDSNALYVLSKSAFNSDCATQQSITDSLRSNKREIILIAYVSGWPAGFLCGELYCSLCCNVLEGKVNELFVDEKYRKQGVATKLIGEIEAIFKNANVSVIEIAANINNHTAQAFYSSCGYQNKTRMIYYKNSRFAE